MALFSWGKDKDGEGRETKPAPAPRASPVAPPSPGSPPSSRGLPRAGSASLKEGLQRLYARRPTREAFAAEAAQVISQTAAVKAVALLEYDERRDVVRPIGSVGLEQGALDALAGGPSSSLWEIPLRSVKTKRINVLEAAHENPFVPQSLVALSPRRLTIAVMPFFRSHKPVGVVLLFSPSQRGFPDHLLRALAQGLKVCAVALTDLRAAESDPVESERPSGAPGLLRGIAALEKELTRVTSDFEEAERQRHAEAAERVTAETFLQAERGRVSGLEKQLEEGETALVDARAEIERLRGVAGEIEQVGSQAREALAAAERAREESKAVESALAEARGASTEASRAIEALTAERDALRGELEGLRRELDDASRVAREHGDTTAALEKQLEEARAETIVLGELEGAIAGVEREKSRVEARKAELEAELEGVQAARLEAETSLGRVTEELAAAEREQQALRDQMARLEGTATAVETQGAELADLRARIGELETERDRLAAELEAERDRLSGELETAAASRAELETERQRDVAVAEGRLAELESNRESLANELETARQTSAEALGELREQLEVAERERREMAEQVQHLTKELAERDHVLQTAEQRVATVEPIAAEGGELDLDLDLGEEDEELELLIDRSGTDAEGAVVEGAGAAAAPQTLGPVLVFDRGPSAAAAIDQLAALGIEARVEAPDGPLADLPIQSMAGAVLNFAFPECFGVLRALRAEGSAHVPISGYVLNDGQEKGFSLGKVDFLLLPIEARNLADVLGALKSELKRVVTMGADMDVVRDVRSELQEARMSTAVVFDARQAIDLLPIVRPEAAVFHLSPTCPEVFRAVSGIRRDAIGKSIPIVFLIDRVAAETESAFLANGAKTLAMGASMPASEIAGEVALSIESML